MKKKHRVLSRKGVWLLLIFFSILSSRSSVYGQYVHTNGTQILDENGNDIYFSGMNLGNWLLWEGYLMMDDFNFRTHTQFFNNVKDAFGGDLSKAAEFQHQWRLNYVTAQGISDLKDLGYNSVRVPFHYNLFWDPITLTPIDSGFQYLDRVIDFCRDNNMYVLLDMHAAPGYQNPGDHADNINSNASHPRETVTFWDNNNVDIASQVWGHIAEYYENERVIWGYDLINEPVPQAGREYELLTSMVTMRNAIRAVDNNHIIVAEGSWWGSDMQKLDWTDPTVQSTTGISSRWDNNLVYQTHHYSNDVSLLDGRLAICTNLGVPMILGEYGETDNTNIRVMTDWCIDHEVDFFPWSFKKMSKDRCLWTINLNTPYNELKDFINDGTPPSTGLYDDMIDFAQNNIANGSSPALTYHQGWYDATKPPPFVPDPTKTYYIDCPAHDLRLASNGSSEEAYTTSTSTTGDDVAWEFIDNGAGYWHLDRAAGGSNPRLGTDDSQYADMESNTVSGNNTYFDFAHGETQGSYFLSLSDSPSSFNRLQIDNSGAVKMTSEASNGTWESFTITEIVDNSSVSVIGISVSSPNTSLNIGDGVQFTVAVSPTNADNKSVSWTTSNSAIATVNSGGLVTAHAVGSATITATSADGGYASSSLITVSMSSAAQTVEVTFNVDMSAETVDATGVHLAGSLNGWNTTSTVMVDQGSGVFAVTLTLTSGEFHEFKYLNGNAWGKEETPGAVCSLNTNRYLYVTNTDLNLSKVDFGGCAPAGIDVTFQVDMSNETVGANGVHLVGFPTGWATDKLALVDQGAGIYAVTKQFQEGEILEFKYINGNAWGMDETPGIPCSTSSNRVLEVPSSSGSVDLVSFGGCSFDYISYASAVWSNGTGPSATDHVSIEEDYTGNPFDCDDLYIASGSSLTVSKTGAEVLDLDGDLVNEGTLIISSGAGLINSGAISGDGTYEIHRNTTFDESTGKYSFVGSPVVSSSVTDLGSLVYEYDEAVLYGADQGLSQWVELTSGTLEVGRGYASAFTGDLVFSGTPNSGAINVDISKTADAGLTADEGFNLVSNPYPSSISFTAFMDENRYDVSTNPTGAISGSIYVWDDESSNTARDNSDYLTISAAGVVGGSYKNSNTWSGSIGSVQGFFVKVDDSKSTGSHSIDFTDAMRNDSNDDGSFFRQSEELKTARILLKKVDEDYSKDMLLAFGEVATEAVDSKYDAQLFGGTDMQLFSMIGLEKCVINALPMSFANVDLGVQVPEIGTYELVVSEAANDLEDIRILDQETGEELQLIAGQKVTFTAGKNEIMNRFTLLSARQVLAASLTREMSVLVKDNSIHIALGSELEGHLLEMGIYTISGKLLEQKTVAATQGTVSFDSQVLKNHIYLIKVATRGEVYMTKLIVM